MKISTQRQQLGLWLSEQLTQYKAQVVTVSNQRKLWQEVYSMATNNNPKLVICFDGEQARGGFNQRNTLNRVDRQWVVVVLEGRGFRIEANGTDAKLDDFNDVVEHIRQQIRRLLSISMEAIDYVSTRPLPGVAQPNMANVHLDGYVISFTTANDIPGIRKTDPAQNLPEEPEEPAATGVFGGSDPIFAGGQGVFTQ